MQQLKLQYHNERKAKITALQDGLSADELNALKAEFETEILATDFFRKMYEKKGFEYAVIQTQWQKFLAERFLAKKYRVFENYEREVLKVGQLSD